MTSLTSLLWHHYPLYYDVSTMTSLTSLLFVTNLSTMTSLPSLLWRLFYDVTNLSTMTSLPSLLWRHYPLYYDVSFMTSLTSLLWRHYPLYYYVTGLDAYTAATCLVQFFRDLPDPLVPYAMFKRCVDHSNSYVLCRQARSQLPLSHYNLFVYIIFFLQTVLKKGEQNLLSPQKLALLFGSVLLRPLQTGGQDYGVDSTSMNKRATFVYHFLTNEDDTPMYVTNLKWRH